MHYTIYLFIKIGVIYTERSVDRQSSERRRRTTYSVRGIRGEIDDGGLQAGAGVVVSPRGHRHRDIADGDGARCRYLLRTV